MANRGRRSPARLIAPLALVVGAVAVLLVIQASTGSNDGSKNDSSSNASTQTETTQTTPRRIRPSYTVKLNDTLGLISQKTGVSVARIQELNPELDPQNLIVGQKIKLRE
jgi:LysM repeat protein